MAARPRFRQVFKTLAPRWLTEGEGELVLYSLGLMVDAFLERLRLGMLARFPENGPTGETAPADALVEIGRDRRVVRGVVETDAEYAVRLRSWLDDRRKAGGARMMLRQLAAYLGPGFSFRLVDRSGNWYSRDVDGVETESLATGNWDWDAEPEKWWRFWIIIYPPVGGDWEIGPEYADGSTYGSGDKQWGVAIPREQIASVRHIIGDWKPARSRCVHVIAAFDPASFDPTAPEPDGLWGGYGKTVAGVRVRSRLSTARYLKGV